MRIEDVTIIGAGPAGMAAAIQLRRWGLEPLLLERDHAGGLLVNAGLVENYPGFPRGIPGRELVELFTAQLAEAGASISYEEVRERDHEGAFLVRTSRREFGSRVVIIASGTEPVRPDGLEIGPEVAARVFHEVHPLFGTEQKRIAIVGAGDAAFDYALSLAGANEVFILNRGTGRRCLPLLWDRAQGSSAIDYQAETSVVALEASGDGLVLRCRKPDGDWELAVDYVIFAIGRRPRQAFLTPRLREMIPALEGEGILHLAGDVKNDIYRQTAIATGDGVRAAMRICRWFEGNV